MEAAAPAPACDPRVVRQQLEREADGQREGVVGDALVIGAERHGHGDVVSRRGGDVDPVVADAKRATTRSSGAAANTRSV